MKTAIYPGSFNPWHSGHNDVVDKALRVFDRVVIAVGVNPEKATKPAYSDIDALKRHVFSAQDPLRVSIYPFTGLLVHAIRKCDVQIDAVIRGLRNGNDLQYEMNTQYWNEDLGMTHIPTFYVITDRRYSHISSSAIRAVEAARREG